MQKRGLFTRGREAGKELNLNGVEGGDDAEVQEDSEDASLVITLSLLSA